jgi:hypothetical protein
VTIGFRTRQHATGAARAPNPQPTAAEALGEPLRAFPSLRIECERCGAMRMISARHGVLTIREIIASVRHADCGGRAGWLELVTAIDGVANGPVRRIVLRAG